MDKIIELWPITDLNTIIQTGFYRLQGVEGDFINGPSDITYGWSIMVVGSYADTTFQELHTTFNVTFVRMRVSGVVWSKWERQATATPPAVYDLPLSAGYIAVDDEPTAYRKTQNERCHVYAEVQKSDGSYWVEGSVFASLPEGFRPPCHVVRPCFFSSGGSPNGYGHLHIYHDGRMVVQAVSVNTNTVFFDIGFWSA